MADLNQYHEAKHCVAICMGDPAGIGIEITLKAIGSYKLPLGIKPVLVGCRRTIEMVYSQLTAQGVSPLANPKNLHIEDFPFKGSFTPGEPNANTGEASFLWLKNAINFVQKGHARALVTGPIAKHAWHEAGHCYPGQTELLGELTGIDHPSMLFTAKSPENGLRLNTLLATTHLPLSKIHIELTPELISSKLDTLADFCQRFKPHPKLAVAGLNPHAGEKGKLGAEEINWLLPTLQKWQAKNQSITLSGPIPPDTCWINAAKAWQGVANTISPDGFLALYHDQGLIPMKIIAFDEAVNTTLGLPFIRTSPDHGTAFDIAGLGCARHNSMLAAIQTAWDLTN